MPRFTRNIILGLALGLLNNNAFGDERDALVPVVQAKAWVLIDHHSGFVIAARDAEARLQIGGLTKLMSAYIIFEHIHKKGISLDTQITIDENATRTQSPRIYLKSGETVTIAKLIDSMIVRSANDATLALVDYVADDEAAFVELMNAKAQKLGLNNTQFQNATGIDQTYHYSSALDMAKLSSAFIKAFPNYYQRFSTRDLSHKKISHHNRNALLWQDNKVDGILASLSRASGYCLIASAKHQHMRMITTIVGAKSESMRVQAAKGLLTYGFQQYETRLLYRANIPATKVRVWMGNSSMLPLGISQDLYVTIPRGSGDALQSRLEINDVQYAPTHLGQQIGTLNVYLNDEMIAQHPLVALKEIKSGNLLQRTLDNIQQWFE